MARVARAHGVNANQVFQWRRQYHRGVLGPGNTEAVSLLPVRVTEALASELAQSSGEQRRRTALGMIQVELPKGAIVSRHRALTLLHMNLDPRPQLKKKQQGE